MKYKLPKQYRNVEYVDYPRGNQEAELVDAQITVISPIEINEKNFPAGRVGFDIQTSTGNYFAKGILVHNSLGILYRRNGEYRISTRGNFHSDQAVWATNFLHAHYNLDGLPDELTLLFEIIYPENRVIVDYQGREEIVLIAARNRFTGDYLPFSPDLERLAAKYGFPTPKVYTFRDIGEILARLKTMDKDEEGFVVEFSDGQRFKFKGDKYLELHRLVFSLSFKNTLQAVATDQAESVRAQIPDEFLADFNAWAKEIEETRERIKREVVDIFTQAPKDTRKDFAVWVMSRHKDISSYLFALLDGHDLEPIIYKKAFENRPNEMAVKQSENTA